MDANLIVDLEPRAGAVGIVDDLKYPCWAIALRRLIKQRQVDPDWNGRVGQLQMMRLIFLVVSIGDEHRRELVEADDAIRLRIDNLVTLCG